MKDEKEYLLVFLTYDCYLKYIFKKLKSTRKKQQKWQKTETDFREDFQMASKYIKKCSTSLVIRRRQIRTKKRNPSISPEWLIKKAHITKCGVIRTLIHCWCGWTWYNHFGKKFADSFKNNHRTLLWQSKPHACICKRLV